MSAVLFDKVAIIGIGLIGSSIARAARKHKLAKHISIADASEEARKIAAELKLGETVHADPAKPRRAPTSPWSACRSAPMPRWGKPSLRT